MTDMTTRYTETAALARREERLNELLKEIDDWLRRHNNERD